MNRSRIRIWFVLCLLLALASSQLWAQESPEKEALVVFLVRHAEKVDDSRDPELSAAGKIRAEELARVLRDANVEHVHSSDFIRTRDTAAPLADRLGLLVELYDPGDLSSLVERLRSLGGRHLVVGHSGSTPNAVYLLGGEPGTDIDEAAEYDRLYIVTLSTDETTTVLMRYGEPFEKSAIE